MSNFVHLHGHSDFSLKDAISTPERMAKRLHDIGQNAIALTDHGQMSGIAIFDKKLKKHGIKLIAGCEMYVSSLGVDDTSTRDTAHITLLAANMKGYRNLSKLHSLSWERPAYYYDPRTDLDLLGEYSEGIIALSGCLCGVLLKPLMKGEADVAEQRLKSLKQIFGKNFFLELQDHRIPEDEACIEWLVKMAGKHKLKTVATNDYHYVERNDWVAHDMIIACGTGAMLNDPNRKKVYRPEEFFIKDYDQMAKRFEDEELAQSVVIADMCEPLALESEIFHLPIVAKDGIKTLRSVALDGLKWRYGKDVQKKRPDVMDRFEYELKAIDKGGFTQYLLLMRDMYAFMEREGIPYGLGRGSAAASIVCYALGITGICPLQFDLLFERFINPERVSAPDIDCDISAERRGEVLAYLKQVWGDDRVSQIVTFGTLGARAAIRDMARTIGGKQLLPLADKLAKLVPENGSLTTDREDRHYIDEALAKVKEFKKLYEDEDDARKIIDAAREVEGIIKNASIHAAGVVIADRPLTEYVPLLTCKEDKETKDRPRAVAYAMNELEDLGLIKFDLLGLKAVDTIKNCIEWLKADKVVGKDFDINKIPLDDAKTYSLLGLGLTAGVFQFESAGMAGWLRKLKADNIEDLISMVALYRPGPMAFIETFINRKHGKEKVSYPDPRLKAALSKTYGVAVFQEQLMQIGVIVAGWSLARADQLRKVIGKKIIDKIAGERKQFADDASKNGYDWEFADDLFENFIEPAARYSFNRGHAAVYGVLAYQTAYLKANYPVYYYGSLLASVSDDSEKTALYIADARALGVAVVPPDIMESDLKFTALPERQAVMYGMLSIKNVGEKAIQIIMKERKNGPFTDLFDLVARTRNRLISSRTIESLIYAGALDSLPGSRHDKARSVVVAIDRASMQAEDRERVAAGGKPVNRKKPIPDALLLTGGNSDDINLLSKERELLGTYLSGHPFDNVDATSVTTCDLQSVRDLDSDSRATICGIVSKVETITTKAKAKMYIVTIEDSLVSQQIIVFPSQAKQYGDFNDYLDQPIVVTGRLEADADEENVARRLILEKFHELDDAPVIRKTKKTSTQVTSVNRYHLSNDNYQQLIAAAKKPCSFVLPTGQELICP